MENILFNKKHLTEYALFGSIAGLLYVFAVWLFLVAPDHQTYSVLIIGSVFFMFVIMFYALKLTRRGPENYSTWAMIIMGQVSVAVGIVVSVAGAFLLCCFYIPGFVNGGATNALLPNAARDHVKTYNSGIVQLIFATAIIENYIASAFISAMVAYAVKPNQTEDHTPTIFEEPAETDG
jgi:hypothetical protein